MLLNEILYVNFVRYFRQAFFDLENLYLQTERIKNNHYTKNHIEE